ncbi:DUF3499 family protein [Corynebacterium sp.]|uniref:DUF3499 family protein n=1 Tax=Corynebacterium sp. TaxID=1720 RepID=UPI0026DB901F|nr:DUF3499 family protein [Corynebacterium sp.]MDO4914281.1 DUF3499 family protein [Corynebacterium sp.]
MNEKRVNKKRLCCRPGCGRPAAATLVYSHAEETVIVGPLSSDDNPHSWDLCARHSAQFRPPEGWTVIRDEPDVDGVDDMTALLDSVNDPQGGDHRVDAGSVAGPGAQFGAGSGARHTDAPQGAVADIQDTISRLNGHRGEATRHRNEGTTYDAETNSDDDAEWEIESPLLQAAKERERRRRLWRGRGEEPTVESSYGRSVITTGQTGRHRRPDNHHASHVAPHNRAESHRAGTEQEPSTRTMRRGASNHSEPHEPAQGWSRTQDSSEVRHPSLHNIPGRKRGHLHAVPDPDPDGDR